MSIDFGAFDVTELEVLEAGDGVALPDMGASIVVIVAATPDGEEILGEADLGVSGSLSTSCC
ncbi:hypothetical protein [Actinacidiphila yeochonensis]|uniref:hypothetical protein n=1 Tax=Actinacidiphila yeochonensis TaxID=89050 RepID=UPI00055B9000|nr:hypothetical protein [Actinacidiphila yeochonensis]